MTSRHFKYLTTILTHTFSVGLSLLVSSGTEQLIITYTDWSQASSRLVFATIFPILLILQLYGLQHFFNTAKKETRSLDKPYKASFAPDTVKALNTVRTQIEHYLNANYQVQSFVLYVFDWQQNIFLCPCSPNQASIELNHAVVKYAEHNRQPFSTERAMDKIKQLSDMQLAELITFMNRNKFVLLVPLYTEQAVYGFLFFTLEQIKDSKLFALKSFDALQLFSEQYAALLQKVLIYDALVLKKS